MVSSSDINRKSKYISKMEVIKRDGRQEKVSFDKIIARIEGICERLDLRRIDPIEVAKDTVQGLYDGITTEELDFFASNKCAEKILEDPEYNQLAAGLCISNLQKTTSNDFMEVTKRLYNNKDKFGNHNPLVTDVYHKVVMDNIKKIEQVLDYERDYYFDFFAIKTLERAYLIRLKDNKYNNDYHNHKKEKNKKVEDEVVMRQKYGRVVERPQHMIMRVAIGIHGSDIDDAIKTYNLISEKYFTHASPTLYNAGSQRPQMSSCFLLGMDDSIEGIFKTITNAAKISKWAGGIGIHISDIRAMASLIRGTNGNSDGIIPLAKVLNQVARYVNQGGRRNGAISLYIEPWHADVFAFCELKQNTGVEELRARDIFLALWIPDLFMKRVEEGGYWSLMCPDECPGLTDSYGEEFEKLYIQYENEGCYKKQVKAEDLWFHIESNQIETGMPYMLYKDNANKQSNQKNIGIIKSSNLCSEIIQYSDADEYGVCLTADTEIVTENGIKNITECDNENILCYYDNDINLNKQQHYEKGKLICTGTRTVYAIKTSGNKIIKATNDHPFLLLESRNSNTKKNKCIWKKVENLKKGDKLITPRLNTLKKFDISKNDFDKEYLSAGWMIGDGWMSERGWGVCFGPTEKYAQSIVIDQMDKWQQDAIVAKGGWDRPVVKHVQDNGVVMWQSSKTNFKKMLSEKFGFKRGLGPNKRINKKIKTSSPINQASFLSGYFSADGCVILSGNRLSVKLTSASEKMLYDVQSMLIPFGISSKICFGKVKSRPERSQGILSIHGKATIDNFEKYINFNLCPKKSKKLRDYIKSYERKRIRYSDYSKIISIEKLGEEKVYDLVLKNGHNFVANGHVVHNCNLASICLPRFIEFDEKTRGKVYNYQKLFEVAKVITKNLNKVIDLNYYPVEEAKISNMRHRPIGIGVQGLADVYCIMDLSFDSDEARIINRKIFETIYFGCLTASNELAIKYGPYETFKGSPFSEGLLQYHLWGLTEEYLLMNWDWKGLIDSIKKYGTRNSLLTAVMPTASTSQIMGNNECIEAYTTNLYTRTTLAGEYIVVNKHLIEKLISLGLWTKEIREEFFHDNGSIQKIVEIPDDIKEIFKTAYEMKTKPIVQQAVERGPFIDHSQSMNLFSNTPDFDMLTSSHFYSWRNKLKTGMYYLRSQPAVDPIKFGLDAEAQKRIKKKRNQDIFIDSEESFSDEITDTKDPRRINEIEINHGSRHNRENNYMDCEMCSG